MPVDPLLPHGRHASVLAAYGVTLAAMGLALGPPRGVGLLGLGAVVVTCGAIVAGIGYARRRTVARLRARPWVQWRYDRDAWTRRIREEPDRWVGRWLMWVGFPLLGALCGWLAGFTVTATPLLAPDPWVGIGLGALLAMTFEWTGRPSRRRLRDSVGEVILGEEGLFVTGECHPFRPSAVTRASLDATTSMLRIDYESSPDSAARVEVWVPPAHHAAVRAALPRWRGTA